MFKRINANHYQQECFFCSVLHSYGWGWNVINSVPLFLETQWNGVKDNILHYIYGIFSYFSNTFPTVQLTSPNISSKPDTADPQYPPILLLKSLSFDTMIQSPFPTATGVGKKNTPLRGPQSGPVFGPSSGWMVLFWRLPVPVARDSDSCVRPSGTDLPLKILGVFFGTFVSVSLTFQLASWQLWVRHDSSGPFVCLLEQQLRKGRRDPSCSAGF